MESLRSLPISTESPAGSLRLRHLGVTLRPTRLTDAEPIAACIAASLPELRAHMGWAHAPQGPKEQLARLKHTMADYVTGRALEMVLVDDGGAILSLCGLERRVPLNPRGWEIGYWTPTPVAGRGWATIATQLCLLYAFDLLGADRVQILVDEHNAPSRRVVEKCGFVFEAVLTNVTTQPSAEQIANGYRAGPRAMLSALWPETYRALSWPSGLRRQLEVNNLVGERVTGFWSP